jgi:hypothetical protein
VRSIIKEALFDTEFFVELVSDSDEIGIIQKRIVSNIYNNEIIICDVSAKNPNVMFELGMRLAFDKPAIIIKDDRTNYSFDTGQIEHLEYPRELNYHPIQAFIRKLKEKVIATYEASKRSDYTTFLKHFGQFLVANIEQKKVDKYDYMLEAISDLRKEVRGIVSASSKPNLQSSIKVSPTDISLWQTLLDLQFNKKRNRFSEFLKTYLKDGNTLSAESLDNPDSVAFRALLEAFLTSPYAPVLQRDPKEVEAALNSAAKHFIEKESL